MGTPAQGCERCNNEGTIVGQFMEGGGRWPHGTPCPKCHPEEHVVFCSHMGLTPCPTSASRLLA